MLYFFNVTTTTEIYTSSHTISLPAPLPISRNLFSFVAGDILNGVVVVALAVVLIGIHEFVS